MRAFFHSAGLLLVCAAAALSADQKDGSRPAPAPARPAVPRNPAGPKAGIPRPKLGAPLSNPAGIAARLYRATPEERDRALEKLPPKQQEMIRTQLQRFDAMPREQQQEQIRRAERFAALSPDQQALFVQNMQALAKLPQDRRFAIGRALRSLQPMPDDQRQKILASDQFKSQFSPEELKIVTGLSEVMLPPL